jgi:hypothetical protein
MTWVAYVDESMRVPAAGAPGRYILAAAVLHADDVETTRDAVRWLSGKHRRFHWRDSSPVARDKAVGVVAELSAVHLVVVGTPLDRRRQERGRRLCLARLLYELESADVSMVSLEARTESLNVKDLSAVGAWRAQNIIGHTLAVNHAYPRIEPLLWLPDIVAGAVAAAYAGDEQWRCALIPLLDEISVSIE